MSTQFTMFGLHYGKKCWYKNKECLVLQVLPYEKECGVYLQDIKNKQIFFVNATYFIGKVTYIEGINESIENDAIVPSINNNISVISYVI